MYVRCEGTCFRMRTFCNPTALSLPFQVFFSCPQICFEEDVYLCHKCASSSLSKRSKLRLQEVAAHSCPEEAVFRPNVPEGREAVKP